MLGTLLKNERQHQYMSQTALAEGICSVSYLSKIESNQVSPSDEILILLFDCLGIDLIHDPILLERFNTLSLDFWNRIINFESPVANDELQTLAQSCFYSKATINAHLVLYYINRENHYIDDLQAFIDIMTTDQRLAYVLARGETFTTLEQIEFLNQYKRIDHYGLIHHQLGVAYYRYGSYYSAIDNLNSAYQIYADTGNVKGMYQSSMMLGSSYANLTYTSPDQMKMMLRYYNRALRLTRYLDDSTAVISVNYNIGATYLLVGMYEAAQSYLVQAYNDSKDLSIPEKEIHNLILQKLAMLYIFQNNLEAASRIHNEMERNSDCLSEAVYQLITFMIEEPNYLHHHQYGFHLETCKTIAEKDAHHGYVLMYVKFLIQYYSANRLYKKALILTKKYNIS